MIMRKRLIDQDAKPFLYQAIGDYQVEAAKAMLGRDFRIGDLSQIVLSLYGALPLPPDVNPQRNLGQIAALNTAEPSPLPSPQPEREWTPGQQDAGAGRLAQQANRHRHAEKSHCAARQPDGRLGPGGGVGLEF